MSACVRALKYYYSPPLIVFFAVANKRTGSLIRMTSSVERREQNVARSQRL